jgi:hypothetical protein
MNRRFEMKMKVRSSDGHVHGTYDDIAYGTIVTGLQQLRHYRDNKTSSHPEELEWEIKLYEWILAQPDKKEKADEYMNARYVDGKFVGKREAVKKLGWIF